MIAQKLYRFIRVYIVLVSCTGLLLSACLPAPRPPGSRLILLTPTPIPSPTPIKKTATPSRPVYQPGELVDYLVQPGDTLPVLAIRFNTTLKEIRTANPVLPTELTTLPPGLPLKIPIYYRPLWGSPYQILPDSLYINGPAQVGFDPVAFTDSQPGWLKNYREYAYDGDRRGAEIVAQIAVSYSVSPRLLLALLDYQVGALSLGKQPPDSIDYPLGYHDQGHKGLYMQLNWAANFLNNTYYQYRAGRLTSFDHLDGRIERTDPWQNPATVALQIYFNRYLDGDAFQAATGKDGLAAIYRRLFGDPWNNPPTHIPGSLQQPSLRLPFPAGNTWAYTGGPHTGWGEGDPLAALDFGPPSSGCAPTDAWVTAVADGVIARTETNVAILDLDGDSDERTGWDILYLHLAEKDKVSMGTRVMAGDPIGHPSCEGGRATGIHIHIARKYNGEWIPAEGITSGVLAFNVEGWLAANGSEAYQGTLLRGSQTVRACTCSDPPSHITAGKY
jgi:LasA protease